MSLSGRPSRLERLGSLAAEPPGQALQVAAALLAETAALAEAHCGAGIRAFSEALAERRKPVDPPPGKIS